MAMAVGSRFGPYEVGALLGAGGMGVVYRARDTRLHRDVALKVLPEAFAHDPERLARFKREAQMLASLSHQHIAGIFGFEEVGNVGALVLEFVEGPTLADRIAQGPVPLDETLPIAFQIAEALEAAHEQGVVHRDLKPANIKLRPDGTVKVLDFGLAKAMIGDPSSASNDVSMSPTITSPALATHTGTVLGTAAYMSPEQARGKPVDKRTDIWAFGCVLYEMLTGARPFAGEDVTDTIAAIVRADPDWSGLPADTPAAVRRLLRRCLEKDQKERAPDIGIARLEIKEALATPPDLDVFHARGEVPQRTRNHFAWGAACVMAAAAGGLATWILTPSPQNASPQVSRVQIGVAPAERIAPTGSAVSVSRPSRTAIALSPDGKSLVFTGERAGTKQLYIRAMDQLEATPIAGTEGSSSPFFSPDGKWVGFWQGAFTPGATGELRKVPLSGGPAVPLCKTAPIAGASWSANDDIVFSTSSRSGVWRVSAATGGAPKQLTTVKENQGEIAHLLPQMLPGGNAVMFTLQKTLRRWDDAQIVVRSLVTGEQKVLIEGGAHARYVPTGHLVYAQSGTLMAVPFDLERLAVTGSPNGIVGGVMQDVNSGLALGDSGAAQYSLAESGALAYLPGGIFPDAERSFVRVNRNGSPEPLSATGTFASPRLSPDAQRLAFHTTATARNVWIRDLSRGTSSRLITEAPSSNAIWTSDGKRLTFNSATSGSLNLFWKFADGSGSSERLTSHAHLQTPSSWSPDGKDLAYVQGNGNDNDIWVLTFERGAPKTRPFLQTPSYEQYPEFSPNGRWLAYGSNESGRPEVYVQPYPGPGGRQPVSIDGGEQPAWARNGRELFYTVRGTNGTIKMMAVDVTTGGAAFTAGTSRTLFEGRYTTTLPVRNYDVTADGQRFVMTQDKEQKGPPITEIILVQNWTEELKRLVPTK